MKEDIICFIKEFHNNAKLSKAITSSFLSLVPKSNNPSSLDGCIPIFLVGSLYKKFSKLLAGRLKRVLGSLIASCQSALVPRRQLLDGVLKANETVDFATRENKDCLLFKVNFEKEYNMVSWDFLRYML